MRNKEKEVSEYNKKIKEIEDQKRKIELEKLEMEKKLLDIQEKQGLIIIYLYQSNILYFKFNLTF